MSAMDERIEAAFVDEYARIKHEGFDRLMQLPFDELLFSLYRRGYIRGHSARSREVQQDEEAARREGRYPMQVDIRYEGDRLIVDGRDRTPERP